MSKTIFKEPDMKFNPGRSLFEPILPIKLTDKNPNIKFDWKWLGIIITSIIIATTLIWILSKTL